MSWGSGAIVCSRTPCDYASSRGLQANCAHLASTFEPGSPGCAVAQRAKRSGALSCTAASRRPCHTSAPDWPRRCTVLSEPKTNRAPDSDTRAPHPKTWRPRIRHSRTQPSVPSGSKTSFLSESYRSPGGRTQARRRTSPAPRRGRRSSRTSARPRAPSRTGGAARARRRRTSRAPRNSASPIPSLDVRGVRMDGSSGFSTRSPCGPWREKPPSDCPNRAGPRPRPPVPSA